MSSRDLGDGRAIGTRTAETQPRDGALVTHASAVAAAEPPRALAAAIAAGARGRTYVYDFADGSREMRVLLGGKGANLAEMTHVLGPELVPAGFTITTEACVAFMRAGEEPAGLAEQVADGIARLEERSGRRLGDAGDPLLVSVRSGARDSMPGMLETILDLGLNDESVLGLAARTGDERFAWDSYRRFVQMFSNVVCGVPGERFEEILREAGRRDRRLDVAALQDVTRRFRALHEAHTGEPFPQDPREQLRLAVGAVFDSWMGDRAVAYRRINHIPDDWGTAVNVQQMVFGNRGPGSATGVAFSRDEVTGAPDPSGDFLLDAQGEDVVSGVRTPRPLHELAEHLPDAHAELLRILRTLEAHYGDMQDVEFTIEQGRLYMLQTRSAKRPAQAAVRFAVDAVDEGLLTRERALATIDAGALDALLHPTFDPDARFEVLARGVAASPGAAKGEVVFTAEAAVKAAAQGRDVILARPFTEADDVAGFHAARGILTSEGGKASHAALVARGMGRPAVVGAGDLDIDVRAREIRAGDEVIAAGQRITIDGGTGIVTRDDVPLVEPGRSARFERVLGWADEIRRLGVRANADTPADALKALENGAEGIGLCRTEHMFMAADRQPKMRAMIMARTETERRAALAELLPLQQADFEGLFAAMPGKPITIRLLDPPLHEFLPDRVALAQRVQKARDERAPELAALEQELELVLRIGEVNPMLGTRGCRLGIVHPEIYEMQIEAIMRAASASAAPPKLEIMIPLVGFEAELAAMRDLVVAVGARHGLTAGADYLIGTMIELPRACFVAGRLAASADFFSFGTNDLTQTALGFSRDDVESGFVPAYLERRILDRSPFETIDEAGVGALVEQAAALGRARRPEIELGICGEHGGDPDSIAFFHRVGLDYVSCSPYRLPIARVAAAQAAL
jgi:pyruvate,orthophosphate dikinase